MYVCICVCVFEIIERIEKKKRRNGNGDVD